MRIAVLGAGAIGGFIAAALARSGGDVCVVARGAHLQAIRRNGLRVRSDLGEFTVPLPAAGDLRDFDSPAFVLLTFKSTQWDSVLPQVRPAVAENATFVTLQNGFPFWYFPDRTLRSVDPHGDIRETIPYRQVIGGVVHASGRIVEPGFVQQSGGVLYPIGEPAGAPSDRLRQLQRALEHAQLDAPIEPDIRKTVWRKILGNLGLNPVSALTRATVRTMLDDAATYALLEAVVEEGLSVARASDVELPFTAQERLTMARHIADVKTSMLQDLEAGRELELDPIVGAVIELAAERNVAVPHTKTLYALTKLLQAHVRERCT